MLKELKRSVLTAWRFCQFFFWKTFWKRQEVTFEKSLPQLFCSSSQSFHLPQGLLCWLCWKHQCSHDQAHSLLNSSYEGSFPFLRVHTWGITHVFPRKRGEKFQVCGVFSGFWVPTSCLLCSCSCKKYFKWFWTACVKSWQRLYSNVTSCFEKNNSPKKKYHNPDAVKIDLNVSLFKFWMDPQKLRKMNFEI